MRLLITGSSGRVGAAIAGLLAERHEISGVDLVPGRYTTHVGSIIDEELVSAAVSGVNAIVHTASLHAPDLHRGTLDAFVSINVQLTLRAAVGAERARCGDATVEPVCGTKRPFRSNLPAMSHLELVALMVRDYDAAIRFFVDALQFELVEDTPSLTNDGRPKRWIVVRPDGGQTGILLARADGDQQTSVVGQQFAGRVGMFLRVDDLDTAYQRMVAAGVRFVSPPRNEPYGRLAVFLDLEGNRWDLLGRGPA